MNDLRTRLTLDGSDFNTGMDESTKKVEDFQKKSGKAAESVKNLGKSAKVSTKELLSEMGKISGAERSMTGYQRKLSQIQKDIQDLTVNYRAMNAEMRNSDVGKQAAQRIQELTIEAAKYKDAVLDARKSVQMLASDTAGWDAAKQGINALSAGLQGVVSAGILGKKSTEDLVEILAKLKGIEAATNSIITIGNALQRESALMMGIAKVQSLALAKAKVVETTATKGATIAQKAFNLVAKANPYVLLATAVIAVGTALFAFTKRTKEATKAEEEHERIIQKEAEAFDNYKNKVGTAVGNVVGKFAVLQRQYKALKGEAEKKKWIEDNKRAFDELGLSINDTNDAYEIFIKRAPEVIQALKTIAEAEAAKDLYQEKYKEKLQNEIQLQKDLADAEKQTFQKTSSNRWGKNWKEAGITQEDFTMTTTTGGGNAGAVSQTIYQLTPSGEAKLREYNKKLAQKNADVYINETETELSILGNVYDEAIRKSEEAKKSLGDLYKENNDNNKPTGTKPETPYVNQLDILKKQKSELEEQKKYLTFGSDEWKKQLAIIQEVEKEIKRLEEAEQGYLARLKNESLGALKPIDSSKLQAKTEAPKQTISGPKTNDDLVEVYQNAQKTANKLKEYLDLGLITSTQAKEFVDNINKSLEEQGIKATVHFDVDTEELASIGDKLKATVEGMDTIDGVARGVVGSINNVYEAFKNLDETLSDAESGWESFFAIFQTGVTVFESATTILESIATVMNVLNAVKAKNAATTQQETAATIANTTAEGANTAAKISSAAASGALASAGAANSVASIPIAGPILAIAAIATVMAAIIGMIVSLKGFANGGIVGGIVGGNSFHGDKVLARLNSGEMVLNQGQQAKLWNMINDGGTGSSGFGGEVEFTIKGENLVGCLNNYNRKYNRI